MSGSAPDGSPDPRLSSHAWGMIASGDGLRIIGNDVTHTHVNTAHSGGVTTAIFLGGGSDMSRPRALAIRLLAISLLFYIDSKRVIEYLRPIQRSSP